MAMIISVITATYNAAQHLPRLIASLRSQTDTDFEWVVADGGSTDGSLELLHKVDDLNLVIDSRSDFGVYDALNRGIQLCSNEYYLVLGADDLLYPDAIENYVAALSGRVFDIVTARVRCGDVVLYPKKRFKCIYGQNYYISVHSVGCVINKNLHERFGYYTNLYPVGADFLFLKQVGDAGCTISQQQFVAGEFGAWGMSKSNLLASLTDVYRAQLSTGENAIFQTVVFILRIIKNWKKLFH